MPSLLRTPNSEKEPIVDLRTGKIRRVWQLFFLSLDALVDSVPWTQISKVGSSLADLETRSASVLNSGTLPLGRLVDIANAQIAAAAAIAYSKLALTASIVNADIAGAAAIAWSKLDKAGSSLADLATRSAADLTSGLLAQARKWSQASTASTGTQNDFAAVGTGDSLICTNAALLTITGLTAGVAGQVVTLFATGAGAVDLAHQAAGSTAANRLVTPTGLTVTVTASTGRAVLVYDGAASRWRLLLSA
jgi:hypothetical protein